jgi:CRISPR-associated endonuclease Cas2
MSRKYGTFSSELLIAIGEATGFFSWPIEYTESWRRKQLRGYKNKQIYDSLHHLKNGGFVKEVSQKGKKFIRLTSKGQLELLLHKARLEKPKVWDRRWRMIIFDIPEDNHKDRDRLRGLLKRNDFTMLQASVFISPYPLNREAVEYLKQAGLKSYIRIIRVDELDDDADLKKKFNLV